MLGLCLGKQSKVSYSDFERSHLQFEALKSLDGAIDLECNNSDLIFELGVHYAEHRNLNATLHYSKQFIDATEAEVVTDAALDETSKREQGPLLRMKAKLKIAQSLPMDAIETYRYLLALVQAQRKSFGPLRCLPQVRFYFSILTY
ncbi:Protein NPG1 [Camellia lanceoleosa]|uniref:Protein NPG1 n=1 Tax=Camellia lanceoleosa TaxID=1840588 RepID=A0ACC0IED8_9ERIC|nr:Protein NPG1 [Camellia lanceoleosa]